MCYPFFIFAFVNEYRRTREETRGKAENGRERRNKEEKRGEMERTRQKRKQVHGSRRAVLENTCFMWIDLQPKNKEK